MGRVRGWWGRAMRWFGDGVGESEEAVGGE